MSSLIDIKIWLTPFNWWVMAVQALIHQVIIAADALLDDLRRWEHIQTELRQRARDDDTSGYFQACGQYQMQTDRVGESAKQLLDLSRNLWPKLEFAIIQSLDGFSPHFEPAISPARLAAEYLKTKAQSILKKSRGRPKVDETESSRRNEILVKWDQSKKEHISQKYFCEQNDISFRELERFINWRTTQRRRKNS